MEDISFIDCFGGGDNVAIRVTHDHIAFPVVLSASQRAIVHNVALDVGLYHASYGEGDARFVAVAMTVHGLLSVGEPSALSAYRDNYSTLPKPQLQFTRRVTPTTCEWASRHQNPTHPLEAQVKDMAVTGPTAIAACDQLINATFVPEAKASLTFVDTTDALVEMCRDLNSQSVIGVDIENHDYRSYYGFTSLLQISTVNNDYIVDTIALWDHMDALKGVFGDMSIVKIFHAMEGVDVKGLHRDFDTFIVNAFDTEKAAAAVGCGRSLASLLVKYCGFDSTELSESKSKYQCCDWRVRPLSAEMIEYARRDSRYLIYIASRLLSDLNKSDVVESQSLDAGFGQLSSDDEALVAFSIEDEDTTAAGGAVSDVIYDSNMSCLKLWKPKLHKEMAYTRDAEFQRRLRKWEMEGPHTEALFKKLYGWRDSVARYEDESPIYVCSSALLCDMAQVAPMDPSALERVCSPVPPLLQKDVHAKALFEIVTEFSGLLG